MPREFSATIWRSPPANKQGETKRRPQLKSFNQLALPLCALGAVAFCACGDMAPSSFDGTWKMNPSQTKFSSEPITTSLSNGTYDCDSCTPKIHVRADGTDQLLRAEPRDTITVREINSRTVKIIMKRNEKILSEQVATAAPDGQTLQVATTRYPLAGTSLPQVVEATFDRIGRLVPNANAITGSWRMREVSPPESAQLTTFKSDGPELSVSWPLGSHWTAKYDGKDYPMEGPREDSVSLKRLNDRAIEATYKLHGSPTRVDKLTVSDDGKTMTNVSEDKLSGRISTISATRQ